MPVPWKRSIAVTLETHTELSVYCGRTGYKKQVIADKAVKEYHGRRR